ncbi:MAG: DUF2269 family protein [Gemmatimonadetes bacterium]|uniref:DUF2269 family protein n=1 Tax=Candidatus Kutchimonas denitrificans TaxID=3056748 RepID=A0AAE4Z9I5_9BACT|nr:DUF2269 family protein [Gemmatimonadota bacterium]NIR76284.1 DUF2269 family protein [Candidatus Kutchimonas denitrificans]NIS02307.1 DUF2269 family protein [Gemmatimonadota bacterium]NIT68126.1 DUF2269 family protein [Gemmatimonadota bacterium]NIU54350.1 DUF2269 family protein [Gemmatimonadota bacterium]
MVKLWGFLHLAGMAFWLGGMTTLGIWTGRARRTADPRIIVFAYNTAARYYRGFISAVAIVTFVSGIALVFATNREWFQPFPDHWLFQMQIIGTLVFLATLFFVIPNAVALAGFAERDAEEGTVSPQFARRVRWQVIVGNAVGAALIYLVILGVFRF